MKQLIIVRGLPGSGKSTYAQALAKRYGIQYFEADMFFLNENNEYIFDTKKLHRAHQWCQEKVAEQLYKRNSVIVSNTFTTWKEIEPYIELAADYDYWAKVIQMNGKWKNTHNVPEETIAKMQARFVDNKLLPQLAMVDYSQVY